MQPGYTLIEILLVLSIISIMIGFVCPNCVATYRNVRTWIVTQHVIEELYLARNEAIKKQQNISYCHSEHLSWESSRVVMDGKGNLLHSFNALPSPYRLLLRNSLHKNDCIVFTPLGFTLAERSSFYLSASKKSIRIIVSVSGRVRIEE